MSRTFFILFCGICSLYVSSQELNILVLDDDIGYNLMNDVYIFNTTKNEIELFSKEKKTIRFQVNENDEYNFFAPSYNDVHFSGVDLLKKDTLFLTSHCGNISPNYFEANMDHFKNRKVNNCLHGKISVSKEGEIKNCPSTKDIYGHIDLNTLRDVVKTKNIKKLWNISKDDINGCKDCEFRYICLDCRAYTENDNKYSKPKKCDYDPYTNKWKNEKN